MALAIICVHAVSQFPAAESAPASFSSWHAWYELAYVLLSERLVNVALPFFFLVSGFLFFQHMDKWDWTSYVDKLKRRRFSLLYPYLCWNLLMIVCTLVCCMYGSSLSAGWQSFVDWFDRKGNLLSMLWCCNVISADRVDWLGFANPSYLPVHMPMWFVRDLIVLACLAPLFYWPLRRWPKVSVLLLLLCSMSGVWIHLPGFSPYSALYFGLGAALSIHRVRLFPTDRKWVGALLLFWIVGMAYMLYPLCDLGAVGFSLLSTASVISGVFALLALTGKCIGTRDLHLPKWIGSASFFVYSVHTLNVLIVYSPVQIVVRLLKSVFDFESGPGLLFGFLLTPLLTLGVCLVIFGVMKKLCPSVLGFLTGERSKKKLFRSHEENVA